MLTRAQYFSLALITLLLIAVFTALTPAFVNVDLFYPLRYDSVFVESEAAQVNTGLTN